MILYASFKQVKPWPWHVEVIPGVSIVGLERERERELELENFILQGL